MSSRELRQHTRIPVSNPATLEVRTQTLSLSNATQRRNVPITLRDASIAGLSIEAVAEALDKGSTIRVKLQVGSRTIELPAQIVWSKRDSDGITSFAGLRIHLAVTDASTRRTWESFVSEQVKSTPKSAPAPTAPPTPEQQRKAAEAAALFEKLFK